MKTSLCFDTAALISLGHTGLINQIIDNFHIIITSGVLEELETIAKRKDDAGISAEKWLDSLKRIEIRKVKRQKHAENELFKICKKEGHLFISDDVKAIRSFKSEIKCYYSVHMVFLLFYKDFISKERALLNIEKMRKSRDWRNNIITVTARSLFQ